MTYAMVDEAASNLADSYRKIGVRPGDRIVCQLVNRPEFMIAALAAWRCGAIHVGADKDLTASELGPLVDWLEARVAIVEGGARGVEVASTLLRQDARLEVLVARAEESGPPRSHPLPELLQRNEPRAPTSGDAFVTRQPAVILLTSGTTGARKGAIREQGQLLEHWTRTAVLLGASTTDVHLVQLPLAHGFGFGLAIAGLLTGGRLVLIERFSAGHVMDVIPREIGRAHV